MNDHTRQPSCQLLYTREFKYQISVCSCHFDSTAIIYEQEIYQYSCKGKVQPVGCFNYL